MENKLITLYNFKRYMTSQPFFVWHSLKNNQLDFSEENFEIDFWDSKEKDEISSDTSGVVAKTFFYIDQYLREKLKKENEVIILTGSKELKASETLKYLDSGKTIINPVFIYKGAISQPFAFDTKNKHIIQIKYSRKTKRADILSGYYDYSVISNVTNVNDYMLYLPADKVYKKGEIDLIVTDSCHYTNTGDIPGALNSKNVIKHERFMGYFKTRFVVKTKSSEVMLPDFDSALEQIELDREENTYSEDLIAMDSRDFGSNSEWDELMEKVRPEIAGINGNVVSKKDIIKGRVLLSSSEVFRTLNQITSAKILNNEIPEYESIKKAKKVVWYDFEGFSLPISPLDGVKPYQQLVFQVSVIVTIGDKTITSVNHVCDPKVLDLDELFKIIEIVYQDGADAYVVYNKGYELPRMNEILGFLINANHPKYPKAQEMFNKIKENTVDLMNVFKINSKNKFPYIMMHDQKAKASIKNVEKHITKNHIVLPRPITPYKDLDIHNGGMAMNEAILRALDITGDIKWVDTVKHLKMYCENDVKAMIMVYDFITYLKEKSDD